MSHKPNGPLGRTIGLLKAELDKKHPNRNEVQRLYRRAMGMAKGAKAMQAILGTYWSKVHNHLPRQHPHAARAAS